MRTHADGDADVSDDSAEQQQEAEDLADESAAAAKGEPVAKDNKRLRGEVARHRAQLESLKDKDPEFWA